MDEYTLHQMLVQNNYMLSAFIARIVDVLIEKKIMTEDEVDKIIEEYK